MFVIISEYEYVANVIDSWCLFSGCVKCLICNNMYGGIDIATAFVYRTRYVKNFHLEFVGDVSYHGLGM